MPKLCPRVLPKIDPSCPPKQVKALPDLHACFRSAIDALQALEEALAEYTRQLPPPRQGEG
mgnify:CR=1 FL=1